VSRFSGQSIEEAFIHGYMTSDGMDQHMFVLSLLEEMEEATITL
jgi:hypothetical protein